MKTEIHPKYFPKAKVHCACGATYEFGSTLEGYRVELCGQCHPFYTGKQKLVDTAGMVDKFRARTEAANKRKTEMDAIHAKKAERVKESAEEKIARQAQEKEDAREAEKAMLDAHKKESAKRHAEKTVVKKAVAKKPVAKKTAAKKPAAKKSVAKKAIKKA